MTNDEEIDERPRWVDFIQQTIEVSELTDELGREIGNQVVKFSLLCAQGHGIAKVLVGGGEQLSFKFDRRTMERVQTAAEWRPAGSSSFLDPNRWQLTCPMRRCASRPTVALVPLFAMCMAALRRGDRVVRLEDKR